ncbi:MAG: pitrilysin family protein [Acidobacteriota bacterium]
MKKILFLFLALSALASLVPAQNVKLDVREHVLSNGLKILLVPKPGVPRVVCHIYFKVGSINEKPGITGIAHLHEHMMFKGTKTMGITDYEKDHALNVKIDALMDKIYREQFWKPGGGDPEKIAAWTKEYDALVQEEKPYIIKDDLWTLYMKNGGTGLNASTGNETTGYYVTLPSNKVELQMLLESDRMKDAYFREFYSEKDVVMEERRLSENRPGFFFNEQVNAAFFAASPYHWGVIGWMDDLRKITKADLVEFHDQFYVPNNAVAIYVGDFDPERIVNLAEKYFGSVPRGPDVEPIRTYEPPQYSEKRMYGEGPAPTSLQMMFHTPPDGHSDAAALDVLAGVLGSGGGGGGRRGRGGGGGSGRLYDVLVKEKQIAVSVSASHRGMWYAGSFRFNAQPRLDRNVTPEDLEKEIWVEIDKIKGEGVKDEEIQRIKNQSRARFIFSLSRASGIARSVATAELNRGWRSILTDLEALEAVTNEDIKRVAAEYFVKDNSLTAVYKRLMER